VPAAGTRATAARPYEGGRAIAVLAMRLELEQGTVLREIQGASLGRPQLPYDVLPSERRMGNGGYWGRVELKVAIKSFESDL
jgi:hypothetical protein